MKKFSAAFVFLLLGMLFGLCWLLAQEQVNKPISWDNWREAKAMAEKYDQEGDYTKALQYYLEYVRQAEGLGQLELVAWGKNNAAYMIIKQHKQDPTTDLLPAKKLLEEALTIKEASDDCKLKLQSNLDYVKMFLRD